MKKYKYQKQKKIDEKIKRVAERLDLYYEREKIMLQKNGVKSYTIGTRNVQRYDTALAEIRKSIDELESELEYLESLKHGSPRRAVGVVPRDDY